MPEPPDHDRLLTRRGIGIRGSERLAEPALQPFHHGGGVLGVVGGVPLLFLMASERRLDRGDGGGEQKGGWEDAAR